jgi:RHS repeat-associated protein
VRPGYSASYTFDGNGNRLTKTLNGQVENYTYDNGDKLLTAGFKTYQYDAAGRTTKISGSTLTYDDEDRLKTYLGQTYSYNGFDTRVGKNGISYHRDGAGVTDVLLADSDAVYTPGVSERRNGISSHYSGGSKDFGKQSDTSGNVVATRAFDAYGMVIVSTGAWKGPFGYSGAAGYQTDETGLQLLGHRYYDPSTGRLLTRDPIKDGRNWYNYCDNNPISLTDADGLKPKGHHFVPREVFGKGQVSSEAAEIFDAATTGEIPGGHGWDKEHKAYNEAVKEEFAKYCKEKGIDPKKMTKSQAKAFLNRILNSKDARIAGFLSKIYAKIGRAAPKILASSGKPVAKKVAKKVGKAIIKKIPIVGWIWVGYDVITLGPKQAANEFVWPISELWGGGGT